MALIYQTVFPVNRQKTLDDLAAVITTWIAGSPHRNTVAAELAGITNDSFKFLKGHVSIESAKYETGAEKMYGVRLVEKTDATRTTEVTGSIDSQGYLVSVTHEYEAHKIGDICTKMSKPRIVTDVVLGLEGGMDGTMLYTNPHQFDLKEDDLEFVAEIIRNESDNKLPVVYISRDNRNFLLADPQNIARDLAGMAHVLVEPSRSFSFALNKRTSGKNVYNGAVGIHWPNGIKRIIYPDKVFDMRQELYDAISQCALHAILPQKASYDGIVVLRDGKKLEQLKASRDQEVAKLREDYANQAISEGDKAQKLKEFDEILAGASEEIKILTEQNANLEKQNLDLGAKLVALEQRCRQMFSKKDESGSLLAVPPRMAELYEDEFKFLVVEALRLYANHTPDQSRRQDIIKEIISVNPQTGKYQEICDAVDHAFRQNTGNYTERFGNLLRALGFAVEHDDNHPTVYVPGHEGRKVSLSSTPSDVRTRRNENARLKRDLL